MRGAKKRPTSTAPSSEFAFSPPGWPLWELRWVEGVSAHGERTSVLQSCVTTSILPTSMAEFAKN